MRSIDVQDLPEPVAAAIAMMVQTIRNQSRDRIAGDRLSAPVTLPEWDGQVLGTLKRSEIYDDVR